MEKAQQRKRPNKIDLNFYTMIQEI